MTDTPHMLPAEKRTAISLALVYVFRMMGLFMVLPVLSLYADELQGSTTALLGLALGVYGLTQAILQVPFGLMSDRWGRKPVILFGLFVFMLGSIVAAMADDVWWLIAGRALQGAGAIAAAVMALASDLSRDSQRTKVMAIIGASIGGAFLLSLMFGPLLSSWFGVSGLFWFTAGLALVSMALIVIRVPTPITQNHQTSFKWALLGSVVKDKNLLKLDLSIFFLHGVLSAVFVVVPFTLRDQLALEQEQHWQVYLPVMVLSLLCALPVIRKAGRDNASSAVLLFSIIVLMISLLMLALLGDSMVGVMMGLIVFFAAFNVMEASLPAFVTRLAPVDFKGTALGVYSTSQFMGTFIGSLLAAWALSGLDKTVTMFVIAGFVGFWFLLLKGGVQAKKAYQSCALEVPEKLKQQDVIKVLMSTHGVIEAIVAQEERLAYVRYEEGVTEKEDLSRLISQL